MRFQKGLNVCMATLSQNRHHFLALPPPPYNLPTPPLPRTPPHMTTDFCMFLLHFVHVFPERYDVDNSLRLRHWHNDRFSPIDFFPRVPRKKTFQTSIIKTRILQQFH